MVSPATRATIHYPSTDGEPVAETFFHFYALMVTVNILMARFRGQPVAVLSNQYLYFVEGDPKQRVAPDVMVIFGVEPGPRDHYKVWQEGALPRVVFEMTSASTRRQDEREKFALYERLGIEEYWLFDPKGEWLKPALRGYRWVAGRYQTITDGLSPVLGLRLVAHGGVIQFYDMATGKRLLEPQEWEAQAMEEAAARQAAEARAIALEQQLRALGIEPDGGGSL